MKVRWKSIATWNPKEVHGLLNSDNTSIDTHTNEKMAYAVCDGLMREGLGGEGKIFPIKVDVQKVVTL